MIRKFTIASFYGDHVILIFIALAMYTNKFLVKMYTLYAIALIFTILDIYYNPSPFSKTVFSSKKDKDACLCVNVLN